MSRHYTRAEVQGQAALFAELAPRAGIDRSFGLPPRLYAATIGLYLAFIAILGMGFATPGLAIPMAICAIIIVAGFTVPALWARMLPESTNPPVSWERFTDEGIVTLTGRVRAGEAVVQVLILPVLIFLWGLTVVVIAAFN